MSWDAIFEVAPREEVGNDVEIEKLDQLLRGQGVEKAFLEAVECAVGGGEEGGLREAVVELVGELVLDLRRAQEEGERRVLATFLEHVEQVQRRPLRVSSGNGGEEERG